MILKYNNYIKENIIINDYHDLINITTKVVNKLNKDINNTNFFNIKSYITNVIEIHNILGEILTIFLYNNIVLRFNNYIISTTSIYSDDKNLEKLLYEKILIANSLTILTNNRDIEYLLKFKNLININNDLNTILDFILKNNQNVFLLLLSFKMLPEDIYDKYKYLLDANNFDLI